MIVLSGASASGKTEVAKKLASKYGITKIITTTTRNMRKGEVNGVDYFFVSNEQFLKKIENNDFVEYTVYNEKYYGSTKDQISPSKCVVIDLSGLKAYTDLNNPEIVTFFLNCSEKIRFERMLQRGDNLNDAKSRIEHDHKVFTNKNKIESDFQIDSENFNIEEVTDKIFELYNQKLKERHLK